jgi:hypothetical protein
MVKYLRISYWKPFLKYDFATASILNFLIYGENLIFFFYQCMREKDGRADRRSKKGGGEDGA